MATTGGVSLRARCACLADARVPRAVPREELAAGVVVEAGGAGRAAKGRGGVGSSAKEPPPSVRLPPSEAATAAVPPASSAAAACPVGAAAWDRLGWRAAAATATVVALARQANARRATSMGTVARNIVVG